MTELLTKDELNAARADLPGWKIGLREIERGLRFKSYLAGIAFVNEVARIAEEMNHHPDIQIGWRTVTLRISTHSAGGLTALDLEFARKADAAFASATDP